MSFLRADGHRPGTPTSPRAAVVTFYECGHTVELPHDPGPNAPEPVRKFWTDQSVPSVPRAVAACPGCATGRRPRGEIQTVEILVRKA